MYTFIHLSCIGFGILFHFLDLNFLFLFFFIIFKTLLKVIFKICLFNLSNLPILIIFKCFLDFSFILLNLFYSLYFILTEEKVFLLILLCFNSSFLKELLYSNRCFFPGFCKHHFLVLSHDLLLLQ